ncbi:DUF2971 domain-containing protein [Cognatilysobacter segetis]|uniref:DUF2971 domain-containing protein n=1 Tax=Cognatilysobacter segetis TaxID=2492394 RepID=UPI0010609E80|nr:DUF2971 domain-containing protein [Lysobacter segetis]
MESDVELQHFYKFRSVAATDWPFVERIFTHNELYFARPSQFNDPFDCYPVVAIRGTDKEIRKYVSALYQRRHPNMSRQERRAKFKAMAREPFRDPRSRFTAENMQRAMRETVEMAGILSLAERADHVLMWSHYTNSHKGICLRFKATPDIPFFARAQPVIYQRERPSLNPVRDSAYDQIDKAVLTKADYWEYEKEWRIVEHDLGPGAHIYPAAALDGVIFGACCEPDTIDKVRKLLVRRPIELMQARVSKTEFRIHVEPLGA